MESTPSTVPLMAEELESPLVPPSQTTSHSNSNEGGIDNDEQVPFLKGEVQPELYRDKPFAALFLIQFLGMFVAAFAYRKYAFAPLDDETSNVLVNENETIDDGTEMISGSTVVSLMIVVFASSVMATYLSLRMMVRYSTSIITMSFLMAPTMFFVVAMIISAPGVTKDNDVAFIMWLLATFVAMISVCFYCCYRRYIPFAAANLRTGLTAIGSNTGLYSLAVGVQFVMVIVSITWLVAVVGIFRKQAIQQAHKEVPCRSIHDDDFNYGQDSMCPAPYEGPNFFVVALLVLCLYWTQQVVQNVLHVTTAGTVGSWWFRADSEPSPRRGHCACCTPDVTDSFLRATTYSFGSICMGSLLVAMMQTLEQIAKTRRRGNRHLDFLLCILQCMIACLRDILEYFNSWAFVYVALYGYDYFNAGRNVMRLFKSRGWTTFISDRLVFRVLLLCHLAAGVVSGGFTILACSFLGVFVPSLSALSSGALFWVSFVFGFILSGTALFVVESAVRTTLVCFAESPHEFDQNHPDLSAEIKEAWSSVYPTAWVEQVVALPTATPIATAQIQHENGQFIPAAPVEQMDNKNGDTNVSPGVV